MQLRRSQKEALVEERSRDRIPPEANDVDAMLAALTNGAEKAREELSPVLRGSLSVIDRQSSFDGEFRTEQDLRVEGTAAGRIHCGGTLTVERDASVKARVEARDLVVRGRVEGDVVCSGRVLLTSTAVVSGSLKAATLVVEEGAAITATVEVVPAGRPATSAEDPASAPPIAPPTEFPSRPTGRARSAPSFSLVPADER